ncbi:MAG: hypothetical protein AABZ57_05955, partial [Candidatus Margulisiibacteriota bacterium]
VFQATPALSVPFVHTGSVSGRNRVSIIMPTRGGNWLPTTLSYVRKETDMLGDSCDPSIVIALDDRTGEHIDELSNHSDQVIVNGNRPGKLNNLRFASETKISDTDLFLYVDDDVLPYQGSMKRMIEELMNSPERSYLIGAAPVPYVHPFSALDPWGSFVERVLSFPRRPDLKIFSPVSLPWGQMLAFSSDYYPHIAGREFPLNSNDSFFMASCFFPRIRMAQGAAYYFGASNSFMENISRKLRVWQGVESVRANLSIPFMDELQYYYSLESAVDRDEEQKLSPFDRFLFGAWKASEDLARAIYQRNLRGGAQIRWKTPFGTKQFVGEEIFAELYGQDPGLAQTMGADLTQDVSAMIKPDSAAEFLLME